MTICPQDDRFGSRLQKLPEIELDSLGTLIKVPMFEDARGTLVPFELAHILPFSVIRMFTVSNVPTDAIRGQHGHYACYQAFTALVGSVRITLSDGAGVCTLVLGTPQDILVVPPGIWAQQDNFSSNAVVSVFASEAYNPEDYFFDIPIPRNPQV